MTGAPDVLEGHCNAGCASVALGGDRLRVRISNAYGNRPLTIGAAQIALRDKGPAIVAGSGRKLSFGDSESAVIAAGAVLFSDPVELAVPPLTDLAVSFHLPSDVPTNFTITGRYARQIVEAGPLVPALGSTDASILVDLDDLPAAALGDLPKLANLVFDGLRISRDSHASVETLT
jgi:hypothetical protein